MLFDENGDRRGLTQIEQLQGNRETRVGVYDPMAKTNNKIHWEKDVIWIGMYILMPTVLSLFNLNVRGHFRFCYHF